MPPPLITATRLLPVAEAATAYQLFVGALVCVHVWANAKLKVANKPNPVIVARRPLGICEFIIGFLLRSFPARKWAFRRPPRSPPRPSPKRTTKTGQDKLMPLV